LNIFLNIFHVKKILLSGKLSISVIAVTDNNPIKESKK